MAVLLSGLLLAPLARAGPNATPSTYGEVTGFSSWKLPYEPVAEMEADLNHFVEAGARWLRIDLAWSASEPSPGSYRFGLVDRVVNAANARGVRVLLTLAYAPGWASGCPTDKCLPTANHVPAYGAFAGAAAAHFRGRVAAYEIWNEANQRWATGTPDPTRYVAMARAAYPVIKAGDPAATVLVGVAGPTGPQNGELGPLEWAVALWDRGIDGSFDAWSAHPYSFPALPADPGTEHWSGWWAMVHIHDFLVSVGRDVPIWMTEFGTPTRGKGYPDTFQRDSILTAIDTAATYPWAGPLFLYMVRDTSTSSSYGESFGLLNFDRSAKTAWVPVSERLRTPVGGVAPEPEPEPQAEPAPSREAAAGAAPRIAAAQVPLPADAPTTTALPTPARPTASDPSLSERAAVDIPAAASSGRPPVALWAGPLCALLVSGLLFGRAWRRAGARLAGARHAVHKTL